MLARSQLVSRTALEQRIAELGLGDRVRAIGEVSLEEKLELFARTRLYLQPSYFEGFGLASAEAAAAGCCVITTDVGEVRTVIGEGGAYVTPGDAPGLADRIEALLANSGEVRELTERAEHHVAEHFSVAAKRKVFARIFGDLGVPQG